MTRLATMQVWNVELGLAIHIKAPNGKYIVIDLGRKNNFSPLYQLKNEKVGYMVITHPHTKIISKIFQILATHDLKFCGV